MAGATGGGNTYVEEVQIVLAPTERHRLVIWNGTSGGGNRVTSAIARWNGDTVISATDLTASDYAVETLIAGRALDTLVVTVTGSSGSYVKVAVLGEPDPTFMVFGDTSFSPPVLADDTTYSIEFILPPTAAPSYYLALYNGNDEGDYRVATAEVTLNGTPVVLPGELTSAVGNVFREITLLPDTNRIELTLSGHPSMAIGIQVRATDTLPPILIVQTPDQDSIILSDTIIGSIGQIESQSAATLTLNGYPANIDVGEWNVWVPLAVEGWNTLHYVARNGTGDSAVAYYHVFRDTQDPELTVHTPADSAATQLDSIEVSATWADALPTEVYANGSYIDAVGTGSVWVPLDYGMNVITVDARDFVGHHTIIYRTVFRDTLPPTIAITSPANNANVAGDSATISGTWSDASPVTVTVNGLTATVGTGTFTRKIPITTGSNQVIAVATDAVGLSRADTINVNGTAGGGTDSLPPDPATIAPPLNPYVATTVFDATSFIYSGDDPIQTGVAAGTIQRQRASVFRGKVLDTSGDEVGGATVAILGRPELGQTLSRSDGWYDLVVNGGGEMTLQFTKSGYLPVQRSFQVPWQEWMPVDSVVMTQLATRSNSIDFSASIQVAKGDSVTDSAGTRQSVILFQDSTLVTVVLPGGGLDTITGPISVRSTEYTVGALGPSAMPGPLPPATAYTYAVELSVDTALALGSHEVRFSRPVTVYTDNFVGLETGWPVPVGSYDRQQGKWFPEPDGRIIKLLGVTDSMADVTVGEDTTVASSSTALDSLGITNEERAQLALTYCPAGTCGGKTLWRTSHDHFSPWDFNFAVLIDALARAMRNPKDVQNKPRPDGCNTGGSIIGCDNRSLGEVLPIPGTPFTLHYQSDRTLGDSGQYTIDLEETEDTLPESIPGNIIGISVRITVAGRVFYDHVSRNPDPMVSFGGRRRPWRWDGYDAYGRMPVGPQPIHIRRCYEYRQYAVGSSGFGGGGGGGSGGGGAVMASYEGVDRCHTFRGLIGGFRVDRSLGGWSISGRHQFSPLAKTLYLGSGEFREAEPLGNRVEIIPATRGKFIPASFPAPPVYDRSDPGHLIYQPDGKLLIAYSPEGKIRWLDSAGVFVDSLTGLTTPTGLALGPDGSVYFSEAQNHRVRRRDPNGTITTVAGTGSAGFSGDEGPATSAQLSRPQGIAVGPDGSLFIADQNNNRIRRVSPNGTITTFAGSGNLFGYTPDSLGRSALTVYSPTTIAVAPDGTVYFAHAVGGYSGYMIRSVSPAGRVITVAGYSAVPGGAPPAGSTPARSSFMRSIPQIAFGLDGSLVIANENSILRVPGDGSVMVLAGTGVTRCVTLPQSIACDPVAIPDGELAQQTRLEGPRGVAVAPDGSIVFSDAFYTSAHFVRRISPAMPGVEPSDMLIGSEDGSEAYLFNLAGQHKATLDALTGDTLLVMAYDSAGRILTLTDGSGNETTIERDGSGTPTSIAAPFGQRTSLTVDAWDHLATVTNPAGEVTRLWTRSNGLLDSLADPNGRKHRFAYDSLGLISDAFPDGGSKTLTLTTNNDTSRVVTVETAMGRVTSYYSSVLRSGVRESRVTDPAGFVSLTRRAPDGTVTSVLPSGDSITLTQGADPRFGSASPLLRRLRVRLPSGLTSTIASVRTDSLTDAGDPFSLVRQTDSVIANGDTAVSVYTAATRRRVETSAAGRQQFVTLDTLGRVAVSGMAGLDSVRFVYDARGRLTQSIDGGRTTHYGYNASSGWLDSIIDPLNRLTRFGRDSVGRVTSQTLPDGRSIGFTYDSSGNLTSLTPPGRPAHTFQYNAANLVTQYTPPTVGGSPEPTKYFYNPDRQVDSIVRPDSLSIGFRYDSAGRPDTVHFDRGYLRFGYSGSSGTLTSIRSPGNDSLKFTYDGSLPTSVSWTGNVTGSVAVTYDSHLRVDSQYVNGANGVGFVYDNDGLLTQAGGLKLGRSISNGLLTADTLGPIRTSYSYTSQGELAGYGMFRNSDTLFNTTYVRDSLGRIKELTERVRDTVGTVVIRRLSFVYDSVGRLKADSVDGTMSHAFTFDSNGNRLSYLSAQGLVTYRYDAQDRLLASYAGTDSTTYSYTSNGELMRKVAGGDTTQYTYDVLGNLTKVVIRRDGDSTVMEYLIDGRNRRVGRKVDGVLRQRWIYQNQTKPIAEIDSLGNLTRFVYGTRAAVPDYMIRGSTVYRLVADGQGSIRMVVDTATGVVMDRIDYDEFGDIAFGSPPQNHPFGYHGGMLDGLTGLERFGKRDYDPVLGRWTARDPVLFWGGSTTLYAFVGNDPVNHSDPSGLAPGDRRYGLPREFWRWFHRHWKTPGGPDAGKEEVMDAYETWKREGRPNAEGHRSEKPAEAEGRQEPCPPDDGAAAPEEVAGPAPDLGPEVQDEPNQFGKVSGDVADAAAVGAGIMVIGDLIIGAIGELGWLGIVLVL
jgi:RHS repeat-associated protein